MNNRNEYADCGMFTEQWRNPPPPFNPEYDPTAKDRYAAVSASMEEDNYYSNHTREECRLEWARRYNALKSNS